MKTQKANSTENNADVKALRLEAFKKLYSVDVLKVHGGQDMKLKADKQMERMRALLDQTTKALKGGKDLEEVKEIIKVEEEEAFEPTCRFCGCANKMGDHPSCEREYFGG